MTVDESSNINARHTTSTQRRAAAKQRYVRKGTKSCWECRRRKIRCIFDDSGPRDTCRTCWQKGATCIGQEFPEEEARKAPAPAGSLGDRLDRVEKLVEQLYHRVDELDAPMSCSSEKDGQKSCSPRPEAPGSVCSPEHVAGGPAGLETRGSSTLRSNATSTDAFFHQSNLIDHGPSANAQLLTCRKLSAAIPSTEDCQVIYKLSSDADLAFQFMFLPHSVLDSLEPESVQHFVESLREPMHPVLLAKKMLMTATMLQRVPTKRPDELGVSKIFFRIMETLAETAIDVVCETNTFVGTIEALECIVLQAVYLANGGKPRLSLLSCRRAISVAQLMGLHRPHDPATMESVDSKSPKLTGFVWLRLVYLERYLCLLLGIPSSTHNARIITDESTRSHFEFHPLGRLDKLHCEVAAKIIRRNEQDSFPFSMETTHALDRELQMAAATMPPRWWMIPNFGKQPDNPLETACKSLNLCGQIIHFFLIIEIHLPFMLRHSKDGTASSSRMACVDASREVLARVLSIRNAQGVSNIPNVAEFSALIAAMTLLLAHIDARRRDRGKDVLAHQRHTDRDKVEEVLEHMHDGSSKSTDMLSMKSTDVLESLLAIEANAAWGSTFTTSLSSTLAPVSGGVGETETGDSRDVLQLKIPCYGTVTISPDAPPPCEPWVSSDRAQKWASQERGTLGNAASLDPSVLTGVDPEDEIAASIGEPRRPVTQSSSLPMDHNADPRWLFELGNSRTMGPVNSSGLDEPPFQGADAAFFDSMIRGFEESEPPC
ncbi:dehydrocurvularin biosynthesis regulator [Colletotrichum liriopes]|uniref:Dehydrocurvularin biosynthesis regulator n=1 Tax=Colletotrichum liriopes TaxID=708192 RepID=A0AA37LWL6_9PEZI|nr:dehydrocurvularin biosynthesis regulator [Colletotrichum liriopes]